MSIALLASSLHSTHLFRGIQFGPSLKQIYWLTFPCLAIPGPGCLLIPLALMWQGQKIPFPSNSSIKALLTRLECLYSNMLFPFCERCTLSATEDQISQSKFCGLDSQSLVYDSTPSTIYWFFPIWSSFSNLFLLTGMTECFTASPSAL